MSAVAAAAFTPFSIVVFFSVGECFLTGCLLELFMEICFLI